MCCEKLTHTEWSITHISESKQKLNTVYVQTLTALNKGPELSDLHTDEDHEKILAKSASDSKNGNGQQRFQVWSSSWFYLTCAAVCSPGCLQTLLPWVALSLKYNVHAWACKHTHLVNKTLHITQKSFAQNHTSKFSYQQVVKNYIMHYSGQFCYCNLATGIDNKIIEKGIQS